MQSDKEIFVQHLKVIFLGTKRMVDVYIQPTEKEHSSYKSRYICSEHKKNRTKELCAHIKFGFSHELIAF